MITAVTHPHQQGGKDKEATIFCPCVKPTAAFAAPAVSVDESLAVISLIVFAPNEYRSRLATLAPWKTHWNLNWLQRGVGNLLGRRFSSYSQN